jgi:hypothetical protein
MQFAEIAVDSPDFIYPPSVSLTPEFTFPDPAQSAQALLQGFHFQFADGDQHLRDATVQLNTHFSRGDRSGTVEIRPSWTYDPTGALETDLIGLGIHVLVIGE